MKKTILTPKWVEIKQLFESKTNKNPEYGENFEIGGELDILTREFVAALGQITHRMGYNCIVEGVKMDLWKERIWSVIENGGLLAPIAWKGDLEQDELDLKEREERTWYENIDEYEVQLHNEDAVKKFVKTNEVL